MPDVSASEFARLLEVGQPRIVEYIKLGLPAAPAARGKARMVNTRAAIEWLIEREVAKHRRAPDEGEGLEAAELRKARADADLAEIRAATAANQVIETAEVESLLERVMVLVAAQLDGIGGRLAAQVAAEQDAAVCRQLIFDECRRVRAAMAAEFEARAAMAQGADLDPAAAGEDA